MPPTVVESISLLYSTISLTLYALFICAMVKYKSVEPFKSPFFTLSLSLGVADVCQWCHVFWLWKFPKWGVWRNAFLAQPQGPLPRFAMTGIFMLGFAQYNGILLIGINRFTAICNPVLHIRLWTPKRTALLVLVQWLAAMAVAAPIVFSQPQYQLVHGDERNTSAARHEDVTVIEARWTNWQFRKVYFGIALTQNFVENLLLLCLYAWSFLLVWQNRHSSATCRSMSSGDVNGNYNQMRIVDRIQFKYALIGFSTFLAFLLHSCFFVLVVATGTRHEESLRFRYIFFTINDIFCTAHVYVTIVISPQVRKAIWALLLCKRYEA